MRVSLMEKKVLYGWSKTSYELFSAGIHIAVTIVLPEPK